MTNAPFFQRVKEPHFLSLTRWADSQKCFRIRQTVLVGVPTGSPTKQGFVGEKEKTMDTADFLRLAEWSGFHCF